MKTTDIEDFPFEGLFLAARASPRLLTLRPSQWIFQLRKSIRLSQKELARRSGLRQAYISEIESGKADPRLSTIERIAEALHCGLLVLPKTGIDFDAERAARARLGGD